MTKSRLPVEIRGEIYGGDISGGEMNVYHIAGYQFNLQDLAGLILLTNSMCKIQHSNCKQSYKVIFSIIRTSVNEFISYCPVNTSFTSFRCFGSNLLL